MSTVTVSKLVWIKDENGNLLYDVPAMEQFIAKTIKGTERWNKKLAAKHAQGRCLDITLIDAVAYAELQMNMYKHNFRLYNTVVLN